MAEKKRYPWASGPVSVCPRIDCVPVEAEAQTEQCLLSKILGYKITIHMQGLRQLQLDHQQHCS